MTKIVYRIVEHDDGWAYEVDGTFSETFPTHDAARRAAQRRADAHAWAELRGQQDRAVFLVFGGFRGDNARAWFLKIVRNSYHTRLGQKLGAPPTTPFDEPIHSPEQSFNPETLLLQKADRQSLSRALEELPANFREVLVLREIEGLSYKEIAYVVGIPIGTVMSGLARARERLRQSLSHLSDSDGLSRSASPSGACRE